MQTLEREIEIIGQKTLDEIEFAEKVTKEIGYTGLQNSLPLNERKAPIIIILQQMEISPFRSESVKEYKAKKLNDLNTPNIQKQPSVYYFSIPIIMSVATFFMGLLNPVWFLAFLIDLVAFFVTACFRDINLFRWYHVDIERYRLPIPEFVLESALAVKSKFPECRLIVETLTNNCDPFLVMQYQGIDYYLEVWNESGYKIEREI